MARVLRGWEGHCAHPRLPRALILHLLAAGFAVDRVEAYPIVNIVYDPNTYSHGVARHISEYLSKRHFDRRELEDRLADHSDLGRRNGAFAVTTSRTAIVECGNP